MFPDSQAHRIERFRVKSLSSTCFFVGDVGLGLGPLCDHTPVHPSPHHGGLTDRCFLVRRWLVPSATYRGLVLVRPALWYGTPAVHLNPSVAPHIPHARAHAVSRTWCPRLALAAASCPTPTRPLASCLLLLLLLALVMPPTLAYNLPPLAAAVAGRLGHAARQPASFLSPAADDDCQGALLLATPRAA